MKRLVMMCIATSLGLQTVTASSYLVFRDQEQVISRDALSGNVIKQDKNAGVVLEYTLALMQESGGKLLIGPGDFRVDRSLSLPALSTLAGHGKSTHLRFTAKEGEGALMVQGADDVTIRELSILHEQGDLRAGILVDNSGSCQIREVLVGHFKDYGIWLRNNTFLSRVEGCELAGNGQANLFLQKLSKDGRYGDFLPNTVSGCMIYGGGKGIETENAIVVNLLGCSIYQTNGHGIHLHSTSNSVLISGCRTFQVTGHAVLVEKTDELNVSSNIFCWHTGSGIVVRDAAWGTISANEFIDNGSYNPGGKNNTIQFEDVEKPIELIDGMVLENVSGYTVTGNTVFNWNVCPKMKNGIVEDARSYRNVITSNTINFFEQEAVVSRGKESEVAGNISRAEVPYTNIKWKDQKTGTHEFNPTIIQTYQTELTEAYLERLKETKKP